MQGNGSVSHISSVISDGILNSGISCELVDRADRHLSDGTRATMLVFEKYYYRAGNRASLSVLITGSDDRVIVDAIGSGGGSGVFSNFSWGAEDSFVSTVARVLKAHGFTER